MQRHNPDMIALEFVANLADEQSAMFEKRCRELEAENKQLRDAFSIIATGSCPERLLEVEVGYYMSIAREALKREGGE